MDRLVHAVQTHLARAAANGGSHRPALISVVVGTRPEVIKMAPVVQAFARDPSFDVEVCAVGQQVGLLDESLAEWGLSPTHRVAVDATDRRLAGSLASMLPGLADYIQRSEPAMVLVEGDTTTNVGASLAAFYAQVPVAHVEAGLRSGDVAHPFPEEMHRILTDRLASVHYAPTERARRNLLADGCSDASIAVVGNTVVDALFTIRDAPDEDPVPLLDPSRKTLLVTAHRRESFGKGILSICEAVRHLMAVRDDLQVVYVLHPNPAARGPALSLLSTTPRVHLIEPLPYRKFVQLIAKSYIALTDSGGIQEEAPYLGTPVLVTRQVTERPEAMELGLARIVGTEASDIAAGVVDLLENPVLYAAMARPTTPFGDGRAAERIRIDVARRLGLMSPAHADHAAAGGVAHALEPEPNRDPVPVPIFGDGLQGAPFGLSPSDAPA